MPLHPRLARMLLAANGARAMAQACALLSERHVLLPRTATSSDLLSAIDDWSSVPPHVQRVAREIEQIASNPCHGPVDIVDPSFASDPSAMSDSAHRVPFARRARFARRVRLLDRRSLGEGG